MQRSLRTVIILGLVSFFTDVSSEMIYPLLPLYVVSSLGGTPAIFGLIDGAAEMVASLLKWFSGYWADRVTKRKRLVVFGYSLSSLSRPFIGLANTWVVVFILRVSDRIGKGIRTSPRDAMIADITDEKSRGQAYGIHRAMDHGGAIIGPLIATLLLMIPGFTLQQVFLWAAVPAAISVFILITFLKESERTLPPAPVKKANIFVDATSLGKNFYTILFATLLFSLGNSSDAFLLLKLREVGVLDSKIPLMWALLHIVKMTSSLWLGKKSDQVGHRPMIVGSWLYYALVYAALSFTQTTSQALGLFLCFGVFYGLSEAPERALISLCVPRHLKGSAFGLYHFFVGLALLPASVLTGWLWTAYGSQVALLVNASFALLATLVLTQVRDIK